MPNLRKVSVAMCLAAAFGAGCATQSTKSSDIVLDQGTQQVTGWIVTGGEWTIFSDPLVANFDPYVKDESRRCVSVANGTNRPRSEFYNFDGKHVVVRGYTMKYRDLTKGDSPADIALSKRYFREFPVENFCLREFIFIATDVRESSDE